MIITEDTSERMVIDHHLGEPRCLLVLLLPFAFFVIFVGPLTIFSDGAMSGDIAIGLVVSAAALWATVWMIRALAKPSSLFRIVLEPPLRKVALQRWTGAVLQTETCLGPPPYERFEIFTEPYEARTSKGLVYTLYGTFIGYGEPRQVIEIRGFTKLDQAEAFTARLLEAYGHPGVEK